MYAVGIDVSKAKSTVAILNPDGSVRAKPFTMFHTQTDMNALVIYLKELQKEELKNKTNRNFSFSMCFYTMLMYLVLFDISPTTGIYPP